MRYIAIILVFAAVIYTANGLCNTCSVSGIACVRNNAFQVCVDGVPQGVIVECPGTSVCSTGQQVCSPAGAPGSCERCDTCDENNIFACRDYSKFSFCNENGLDPKLFECPTDLVCNVDSPEICVNSSITGIGATCPLQLVASTETPTSSSSSTSTTTLRPTTPNPDTQSDAFCENIGIPGRYNIPADRACQRYISCILSGNGQWIGNLYVCPKNTYFNKTSQACGKSKPAGCA